MRCSELRLWRPGICRNTRPVRYSAGFSFIELMVVIVIIGLLATAATLATRHFLDTAKVNRARSDLAVYKSALESYYVEHSAYPTSDEGLAILAGKFIDKIRLDPWKHSYQYTAPGRVAPYEVMSLGADGREGGDGPAADLSTEDEDQPATAVKR